MAEQNRCRLAQGAGRNPEDRIAASRKGLEGALKARPQGWSRFCEAKSLLAHASRIGTEIPLVARGIEAEILFCRAAAKKIAADSPVFGAKRPKRAHTSPNS
ncbi:MAG: hypothetical protein LBT33_04560 [Spirochaetia bacterium]|jgi:hypothetical protein|nr:hypothetical protein [Spirochaetia bacterium]